MGYLEADKMIQSKNLQIIPRLSNGKRIGKAVSPSEIILPIGGTLNFIVLILHQHTSSFHPYLLRLDTLLYNTNKSDD